MQLHTFSFLDRHHHGFVFPGFLGLRYKVFVEQMGWDLSHDNLLESDQYDHTAAVYSIVSDAERVVAGARALPCNASKNGWSYMLKDAALGKLPMIPSDLMQNLPTSRRTWECTRLVSDDVQLSARTRLEALRLVVHGLCLEAGGQGAEQLISLSPSSFGRLLNVIGYPARPIGREYQGDEDGRTYRAFEMPCDPLVNATFVQSVA